MKSVVILLLLIGIILVAVGYVKSNQSCPPPVVEFRYVPKSFEQEQDVPTPVLSLFGKMFENSSPWMTTQGYTSNWNERKIENVNKGNQII